jgi:16S rRNA (adenine1518-N6/adenine1519-N6)-dimethyltransferase
VLLLPGRRLFAAFPYYVICFDMLVPAKFLLDGELPDGEHSLRYLFAHLQELYLLTLSDCRHDPFQDFLKCNVNNDIKKYNYKKLYVVANLPYYITTPIIIKFIEEEIPVDKLVVMVQKEVGDRFKAKPNTKEYNSLSVYLNYYFSITKLMDISRNVFMPRPNVDSIVVEFKKINNNIELKDKDVFFKLVRDSFVQKRKTLRNNLKNYDLNKIEEVLKKHNFDLSVRAEQLSIEIFAEISNNL